MNSGLHVFSIVKDLTGKAFADVLFHDIISRYGCVNHIYIDNGSDLLSEVARQLYNLCGTQIKLSSARNPRGNAFAEQAVKRSMKMYKVK